MASFLLRTLFVATLFLNGCFTLLDIENSSDCEPFACFDTVFPFKFNVTDPYFLGKMMRSFADWADYVVVMDGYKVTEILR